MSTTATAVSSSSLSQQIHQYFQTRQGDLQQLGNALGNGDLAGAQAAFTAIANLGKNGPSASGNPFFNSTREQDFVAVGKALQSGDLQGAQQAFATLKSTFQQGATNNPATTDNQVGPEIVLNIGSNSGSQPEPITISIGAPSSSGAEQVSLSVGQGSTAQKFTLNLNANTNELIVLNFAAGASTSGGTSASGTTASKNGLTADSSGNGFSVSA